MRRRIRWILPFLVVAVAVVAAATAASSHANPPAGGGTATPIKHVVVIFQENISFDHYFGTYPFAANTDGNTFTPAKGTPAVTGLNFSLLAANPNAANPQRLDSSASGLSGPGGGQITCDMDHNYSDEQQAFDGGKMDKFVESLGGTFGNVPASSPAVSCSSVKNVVMDYYDGNTVTGLWNYAQHYAMSDNSWETTFGPSSPGAINLVSGNTGGVDMAHAVNSPSISTSTSPNADLTADGHGGYSLTSDAQPYWDDCSTRDAVALSGKNIGDLLNERHISWGWFQGGFAPSTSYADALTAVGASQPDSTFIPDQFKTYFSDASHRPAHSTNQGLCNTVHPVGVAFGATASQTAPLNFGFKGDYIPHHEPFQYYASTANPHHLPPASLSSIGWDTQSYVHGVPQFDTANHNYDTSDFASLVQAVDNHTPNVDLPAVSFLKAPGYEDGHAQYSDPKDEQAFVVHVINELEQSPDWSSTAVVINYDDSDGWYDHLFPGLMNPSHSVADNLTNTTFNVSTNGTSGQCGNAPDHGPGGPLAGEQGRCGFGPRLPMLVISPWAKTNYVDSNASDQSSIINFVEYNWHLPGIKGSFDRVLDPLDHHEGVKFDFGGMFDFNSAPNTTPYILNQATGEPAGP
jgi:phospholipase C